MGLSFDYISFRQILESSIGARYQSSLAASLDITATTVNNWCSSRCGAGPSLANRDKIDDFFKKKKFPPIDWQGLMLPSGMDADTYHAKLNEPLAKYGGLNKDERELYIQILDLKKEVLKLKKELKYKELDIIEHQNEALEARSETFHLKKKLDAISK